MLSHTFPTGCELMKQKSNCPSCNIQTTTIQVIKATACDGETVKQFDASHWSQSQFELFEKMVQDVGASSDLRAVPTDNEIDLDTFLKISDDASVVRFFVLLKLLGYAGVTKLYERRALKRYVLTVRNLMHSFNSEAT
jgi:hypothetical protein